MEEFEIPHTAEGFREFFARVEAYVRRHAPDEAPAAYEAPRGRGVLDARGLSHYILGQRGEARTALDDVKPRRLPARAPGSGEAASWFFSWR